MMRNSTVVLKPQLPRPQLNLNEFKRHIADNEIPVQLYINSVKLIDKQPQHNPKTAKLVLSCELISDVPGMPLYELTSNGDIITKNKPKLDIDEVIRDNAKGLFVNLVFPVAMGTIPMGQESIFVDNTMEFYDILNNILALKSIVPLGNNCEIRLNVKTMNETLPGTVFWLMGVYSSKNVYLKIVDGGRSGDNE